MATPGSRFTISFRQGGIVDKGYSVPMLPRRKFSLHPGSLPEHTATGQRRFRKQSPAQEIVRNYMSDKIAAVGFID
jgi:hypothetical protein